MNGRLIGSTDGLFKLIGDRRMSKEGTATVKSHAVQTEPFQAYRGPFLAQMLKLLKPIDGLSDLLRALIGYQGNVSGRRNAN